MQQRTTKLPSCRICVRNHVSSSYDMTTKNRIKGRGRVGKERSAAFFARRNSPTLRAFIIACSRIFYEEGIVAYDDLREWMAALDKAGELKRIAADVDPILELKAEPYVFSPM